VLFNVDQTGTVTSNALNTGSILANGISYVYAAHLSASTPVSITGRVGPAIAVVQAFTNVGTFPITLVNESASSAAANRFHIGGDLVLPPGASVQLRYDVTLSRWVHTSGGGTSNIPPQRAVLTIGTALTYTTPIANGVPATSLEVELVGAGGGGAGSGTATVAGSAGGNTLFGALTANGGGGASGGVPAGTGGSFSGSLGTSFGITGQNGVSLFNQTSTTFPGGAGGSSPFGGAGSGGGAGSVGASASANSGSGGGGGGAGAVATFAGPGGGAGGYIRTLITNPAANYTYTVGALGGGGAAGTNGLAGGNGGAGIIIVTARWQ
jgi:hypothetical protein